MSLLSRLGLAAAVCGAVACGPPAPEPGNGLALGLTLPGPIVPAGATIPPELRPAQGSDVETFGSVLIELTNNGFVRHYAMVSERENRAVLQDIVPGNYEVDVYAGIPADDRNLGVIRFEAHTSIQLDPDEIGRVNLTLTECDPEELELCNPDFGTEKPPPAPPEVFVFPTQTGCENYVAAGTKPEGSFMRNNDNVVVDNSDEFWTLSLRNFLADPSRRTDIRQQLFTAWADDRENISETFTDLDYGYDPDAVCWNPYRTPSNTVTPSPEPDIDHRGGTFTMRWAANGRGSAAAAVIVQPPSLAVPSAPETLPATSTVLHREDLSAGDETADFPQPSTTAWRALLYVDQGPIWALEGAFDYRPDWAQAVNHQGLP